MHTLSERIEHVKTVLSSIELRALCFDLNIDANLLADAETSIFARNFLALLEEKNRLDVLLELDYFFEESMSMKISADAIQCVALQMEMIRSDGRDAVVKLCKDIPLLRWEKYERLLDQDFFREIILLARRRRYLLHFAETFLDDNSLKALDGLLAINSQPPKLNLEQRDELIFWMRDQASISDLLQLAFLMDADDNEISPKHIDDWINRFVEYFERRNRLGQVAAIKAWYWD